MNECKRIEEIKKILIEGHRDVICPQDVKAFGYQYDYYTTLYGDVNDYWFGPHVVNEMIAPLNAESSNNNRPGIKKDKTLYICVHDTASAAPTADALAHAKYVSNGGGGTSWHYSCGDDAIYHQIPDDEIAYHAGDGLVTKLSFVDTLIKASTKKPVVEIIDGYYALNGVKSNIKVPQISYEYDSDGILVYASDGILQKRKAPNDAVQCKSNIILTTDMINDQGLKVIIGENGNYFMAPTYYNASFGYIANRCGNLYSIGIETMVNKGSNLLLTWHRCAKLCAHLLVANNLTVDDVKPHHYFSGKPCPETMRYNHYYDKFQRMVKIEYKILNLLGNDGKLEYMDSVGSNNGVFTSLLDNKKIEYQVKISINGVEEILNLSSQYELN